MSMKLEQYLNMEKLEKAIAEGFIDVRKHPSLPLRIFNYSKAVQFNGGKWAHEVCACRGLIADAEDNIVSRPLYKFFNLGQPSTILGSIFDPREVQENVVIDADFLDKVAQHYNQPITLTRKMDGMLGVRWVYDGHEGIATRGSFISEGAKFATEKWQKFVKYGATEFIPQGWTPIFEVIARHLRIVVPYEWEGLCLLTAVNNETGEEMSYEQLHEMWTNLNSYSKTLDADGNKIPGKPWCRIVEKFDISLEQARNDQSKEEEGYIASVNRKDCPPIKVKIKLAEYLRLHKLLTCVNPQAIWKELAQPMSPWLDTTCKWDFVNNVPVSSMPLPLGFKEWVQGWQNGMTQAFHEKLLKAVQAQTELRNHEALVINPAYNPNVVPFKHDRERKDWLLSAGHEKKVIDWALMLYRGKVVEAYEAIWDTVRPYGKDETFYVEGQGE